MNDTVVAEQTDQLEAALAEAVDTYANAHPRSRALFERAQDVMPGGNTRSALYFDPFPFYVERSYDAYVRDVDGHTYLDALGEFTAGLYGHSNERLRETVVDVANRGMSNGAPGEWEILLAELIGKRFPSIESVRFCNSGTEATLYALTLARAFTGRKRFIAFSGAYHGGTFVFNGAGDAVNAPFDWTVCRYNDSAQALSAIREIGSDLAAVIVEPMMSNCGCLPGHRKFLQTLRDGCTETGAVLIFDEIVTSRMGAGGLQKVYGITPDLTTLGKYLGGGFSFGAFGGKRSILSLMDPTRPDALPHAGTFNNNVYSMTAGAIGLSEVFTPERAEKLMRTGDALRQRLNILAAACSRGIQFTGRGSAMNIHFVEGDLLSPDDLAAEPKDLFRLFHLDLLESGISIARRGQINLSLAMSPADLASIEQGVSVFFERRGSLLRKLCGSIDPSLRHTFE